jgi:hypothetical protein
MQVFIYCGYVNCKETWREHQKNKDKKEKESSYQAKIFLGLFAFMPGKV